MPKFQKEFSGGLYTLFFMLFSVMLWAQPKDNSPYSRIGLGESIYNTLSNSGFAGLSAAYADPLFINVQNPAAIGWLNTATFEAGLYAEHATLKLGEESTDNWTGNLSHLSLAFPMHNTANDILSKKQRNLHWGMSISLLPNSTVGYDIETTVNDGIDTTVNSYLGSGGTNKFFWGNALRYKNFSFGANIGMLFGQLESTRELTFVNLDNSYTDIFKDNISVRGFLWSLGAQHQINLEEKKPDEKLYTGKALIIGAYGNSATDFNTRSNFLRSRFNPTIGDRDTLLFEEDEKGTGTLPAEFTFGVMYQDPGKLRVGAEFYTGKWSKYENEAKPETLFDSRRVAVGVEYIPEIGSYNNYMKRIRYRAGFYHRTDPRLEDLKQYALTVGFGLPVILPRQQTSFVNLAFEFGKYDTPNAIKENFVKMSLGFTLNDGSWFYKRKFG